MSKNKSGVPKTKVGNKGKFMDLAYQLIGYSELANSVIFYLEKEKRITPELGYRLELEAGFCVNIVFNMMNLSPNIVEGMIKQVHSDEEKYDKEVKKFAEAVAPDDKVRTIITPTEFKRDMDNKEKQEMFVRRLGKEFVKP